MFGREGLAGSMSVVALLDACRAYGQPLSVFQRILALEEEIERMREEKRREREKDKSHGE